MTLCTLKANTGTYRLRFQELIMAMVLTKLDEVILSEYEKEIESTKMTDYLVLSRAKQGNLRKKTLADPTLRIVIDQIGNGWSNTPREAKPYVSVRDELTCENGIIFRGDRVVVPK